MEKLEILKNISNEINLCTKCKLHLSRKKTVPGSGSAQSEIMFIGEAPGFHENEQGEPFVGAAGKFLDELLSVAGLKREDVFITNVIKCRPPSNRDPEIEELDACNAFLDEQITVINPKIIVTLGRFSMGKFIENGKISYIHGHPRMIDGRLIMPMYHPAAALHQPALKQAIIDDFSKLPALLQKAEDVFLGEILTKPDEGLLIKKFGKEENDEPKQLSLFG
jgi:DNA polymerase